MGGVLGEAAQHVGEGFAPYPQGEFVLAAAQVRGQVSFIRSHAAQVVAHFLSVEIDIVFAGLRKL